MSLKLKFKLQSLIPIVFCGFGLFICFAHFWQGFDAVSGDVGDARFNAFLLEHSWLWLKDVHPSFFDAPIFYPHANTLAYSDYMLGVAPIYWSLRTFGLEPLLDFQWSLMTCSVLNFAAFFYLVKVSLKFEVFWSGLSAYIFAFALPRIMFLEHAQLVPEFYIVISAIGFLRLIENPRNKYAYVLFLGGMALQFITAFYFIWFWVFSLTMIGLYFLIEKDRRADLIIFSKNLINGQGYIFLASVSGITFAALLPFLYHYALAAKELGTRHWASIADTVPRFYSWFSLAKPHWEYPLLPFKTWLSELPMPQEHFLSFGIFTWCSMILALIHVYQKPKIRFLSIPLICVFALTITSGHFSTWILMPYLFPGASVIRAVGRIQVFMLMFWALVFIYYAKSLWQSGDQKKRVFVGLMIALFFAENAYISDKTFSRAENNKRVDALIAKIPAECEVFAYAKGFEKNAYIANMDATQAAYYTGRKTVNGYSGNVPIAFDQCFIANPKKSLDESIQCWLKLHPQAASKAICKIVSAD